nr:hypothetical protein [Candidatus Cloacimonadota bacterium]
MKRQSICGVICATDCKAYQVECDGCNELEGRVSWAVYYDQTHCPIYICAREKGISSCAYCGQAPCQLWLDTRDPSASDEDFERDILNRLKNLSTIS